MSASQSYVSVGRTGVCFVGPEASRLQQAITLRSNLTGHLKFGLRSSSPGKMFEQAKTFTGQTYRRNDLERAIRDLTKWIESAKREMVVRVH